MKKNPLIKIAIIFPFAGVLVSCSTQTDTRTITVPVSSQANSLVSTQIYHAVNSYRSSLGKSELPRHLGLDKLARNHCEYMRQNRGKFDLYGKNISHWGFEGRALVAREHFNVQNISENVAAAYHPGKSAASVIVDLWKQSRDHQYNMNSSWSCTGVGAVVDSEGTVFATQLFATMKNSQLSVRERFNRF
jgi:uncharacterized protein YkwD